jgi:hypothetical protein
MADFAHWVTAAEPGLGWEENSFLPLYDVVRNSTHSVALEASVIAAPLWTMMKAQRTWEGTARELLDKLNAAAPERTRLQKGWPAQPNALGGALTRIAPHLRALGLSVTMARHGKAGKRIITLHLEQARTSPSASSAEAQRAPNRGDSGVDHGAAADDEADDHLPPADDDIGVADDADDQPQYRSKPAGSEAEVQQEPWWEAEV